MKTLASRKTILFSLVSILLAALAFMGYRVATHNPACDRPGSQTDMRRDPAYRGYVKGWTDAMGCRVRRDVIALRENSCTREGIREILFGTPLGEPTEPQTTRIYVRDPQGQYGQGPLLLTVELPAGARDAGYRFGAWQLWTVAGDDDYVFIVTPKGVEAWPRGHGPLCL